MQFFKLRIILILGLVSVIFAGDDIDITTKNPKKDYEDFYFDCRKIVWKIVKKVLSTFRQCTAELRQSIPDDKERSKYVQCAVKCTLERLSLINNSTGLVDDEDITLFLKKVLVKPAINDIAKVVVGGCAESFGLTSLEERQGQFCVPHGDFLKCLQNQLSELC